MNVNRHPNSILHVWNTDNFIWSPTMYWQRQIILNYWKLKRVYYYFHYFFGINSGRWRFNSVWVHILKYHIWNNLLQNLRIHNLGTKIMYEWGIVLAYNLNNSIYQEFLPLFGTREARQQLHALWCFFICNLNSSWWLSN